MAHTGTIFDLRRFCIHDGPGIRTTVFFKGCPLDCWWCHNPEGRLKSVESITGAPNNTGRSSSSRKTFGRLVSVSDVLDEVLRDLPFYDQSGGGVTFSGGEPMGQIDFLDDLLTACSNAGLHCTVDTCGYAPFVDFERIRDRVNLFLFDLKLMDPAAHQTYIGVSNEMILSNLADLSELGSPVEIRLPLIPDITDTQENLEAVAAFLKPLNSIRRISLLPYNRLGEDKVERFDLPGRRLHLQTQNPEALEEKASYLRSSGFEVRIGG
ncbi:MAG TPA: glycyl-radical enzyme activating protein [Candidatus Acidoferrum sp.]|nr:glycyl-radical enzyme activating protein [Candidatus Acidoferrum sp.]